MGGAGGGGEIRGASAQRFVAEQREGDRFFGIVGDAEVGVAAERGRGQHGGKPLHEGGVVGPAAAQDHFIHGGRQPAAVAVGDRGGGEGGQRRQEIRAAEAALPQRRDERLAI